MSETLYRYYEEELVGFRQQTRDFSERYPAAAGRLRLDASQSADPHVERLVQSFSFMNARIRKKLDDDFPELTDALLSILYPHYLAPIPSMTTVQMVGEASNLQANGQTVPRHSVLHTQPISGVACRFRTAYPVDLWPIEIDDAQLISAPFPKNIERPEGAVAALTLKLSATGGKSFDNLELENLRLHFDGEAPLVASLYELLFNHVVHVEFRSSEDPKRKRLALDPNECIKPVGFASDESILPYPKNSFVGYQLLTELFTFPQKFSYVDLGGFSKVRELSLGRQIEVTFFLSSLEERLEQQVDASTFKLGCTPVVNLFDRICEPIQLNHKKYKYKLTPDVHHQNGMEVYSIDEVKSADPHAERDYKPFYSFHRPMNADATAAFWYSSRSESLANGDEGTDVHMHLVNPDFDPRVPAEAALSVVATCTNRDLPVQFQFSREKIKFELEAAIPLRQINCLRHPSTPLRAPMRRKAHWQLISHLTLNHLSISNSDDALQSLQQMLRLYDFSDPNSSSKLTAINRQMVEGLLGIKSQRVTRRVGTGNDSSFCRGLQITVDLDEEKYIGIGSYLFSSVLRSFLTKYATINSFIEFVATTKQREVPLKHWAPLIGEEQLV